MLSRGAASDDELLAIAAKTVGTISEVVVSLTALDLALPDADGLKWFNWLYLSVTKAVDLSVGAPPGNGPVWNCPDWLARLDVVFAGLYLSALAKWLTPGEIAPKCWKVLFRARNDARLARIQFALAGVNAHIDHDLPGALVQTCREFSIEPVHLSPQYRDYCAINDLLDGIVDTAKKELPVGLLGDNLPSLNLVENLVVALWFLWRHRVLCDPATAHGPPCSGGAHCRPEWPYRSPRIALLFHRTNSGRAFLAPLVCDRVLRPGRRCAAGGTVESICIHRQPRLYFARYAGHANHGRGHIDRRLCRSVGSAGMVADAGAG